MKRRFTIFAFIVATVTVLSGAIGSPARAANIIDEWASVKAPATPELKPVTVDPKTTALLMLDFLPSLYCSDDPRCVATLPAMKKLLAEARAKGATVDLQRCRQIRRRPISPRTWRRRQTSLDQV